MSSYLCHHVISMSKIGNIILKIGASRQFTGSVKSINRQCVARVTTRGNEVSVKESHEGNSPLTELTQVKKLSQDCSVARRTPLKNSSKGIDPQAVYYYEWSVKDSS
jgi:hypothetical protein